ncbi:IscS subfamily cysteine desulfurase [Sporosarcina sp. 179-K 3D1 HS]|uniref:IscS subfamily cysteine desulfurase n=1 Tax=Sporosarcina sp. 179-K 3D1 HS TaxID=3232169 RepID=UPI0039A3C3D4
MYYFDYAASTPLLPAASEVFYTLSERCFGNTSSLHEFGGEAQNMLAYARNELAGMLGVEADGIYFTGGGTEGNLLTLISLAKANRHRGSHLIMSAGEHPSVDSAMDYLKMEGFSVTTVPFGNDGILDLDLLEQAIQEETILLSVQHINPEIGTIQPIEEIAGLIAGRGILFHSDCVQSFGKVDVRPLANWVDAMTVSSHKVYGPKGVGAVYIHPKHRFSPVFPGVVHEGGFRGGTVNVPGIAAFVTAAKTAIDEESENLLYHSLRQAFYDKIKNIKEFFTIYEASEPEKQLPQIIGLGIKRVEGQLIMLELNRHGFAISTGSACQVGQQHASKTMVAMKIDPQIAKEFIRISFGRDTTVESVELLADRLIQVARQLAPYTEING